MRRLAAKWAGFKVWSCFPVSPVMFYLVKLQIPAFVMGLTLERYCSPKAFSPCPESENRIVSGV